MPKLRVYQLARELNRDNAEIIRELQHMGVPVTSHSNTVEDRLADRLRRELGVFAPADGKRVAADTDDFVAIDTPDVEELAAVIEEAAKAEPETPHIEAKAEPKVEETPAPETKVAAPPVAPPPQPVAPVTPPPQAAAPAPPAPPKVEQPVAAAPPPQPAPPQPVRPLTTPSGGRIIPPPTRIGPAVPPVLPTARVEPPHEQRKTMQQIALDKARRDNRLPPNAPGGQPNRPYERPGQRPMGPGPGQTTASVQSRFSKSWSFAVRSARHAALGSAGNCASTAATYRTAPAFTAATARPHTAL